MRIISGEYKSRKIYTEPPSKKPRPRRILAGIRPSSDRTRETLFNILTHRIQLEDLTCLDLFSGTGAYGFEVLSRGASDCDFVDISGNALELVRKTAEELGCSGRVNVIKAGAVEFLRSNADENYDLIFADPPYDYSEYPELIGLVLKRNFKVFVLEFSKHTLKELSEYTHPFLDRFNVIDKVFGRTCLKIFIEK